MKEESQHSFDDQIKGQDENGEYPGRSDETGWKYSSSNVLHGSQSETSMYQEHLEDWGDVQQNMNQAGSHSPKIPDKAIELLMSYGSKR